MHVCVVVRSETSGSSCSRGRRKSFPVGTARIVDVHVRIDQAGHEHQIADVQHGHQLELSVSGRHRYIGAA